MNTYSYYPLAVLLVLLNIAALLTNLVTLPGNWFIAGLTVLFALFVHPASGGGISYWSAGVVVGLAFLGEVIEFAAGAAGAAKSGGSRRGMLLAGGRPVAGGSARAPLGGFIPSPPPPPPIVHPPRPAPRPSCC